MSLKIAERKESILQMLTEDQNVSVSELSKKLGVTVVTTRSDLASLEAEGFLVRTHGGAIPSRHPKIMERINANRELKNSIASRAADFINDGDTVIITAGTTTALIAKYLLGKRDIHIVTNNTLLLTYAQVSPHVRVTLIGGEFRPSEEGVVGPMAMALLDQFHVSKAFIGIDGASKKQGFTAHFLESAELVRKMAEQANEIFVLSNSNKFGKPGFARIIPYERAHMLITDEELEINEEIALKEAEIDVIKAN
ncbi:MAG: DeoR/GlpR family DNA-binding transcription regulator [Pontiellaceae bacterium]